MMALQKRMPGAAVFVPPHGHLPRMREAVQHCRGRELYKHATQAVFGEEPEDARVILVGEQPGDQEAGKNEAHTPRARPVRFFRSCRNFQKLPAG
jgi:hypothetical protein